MGNRIPVPRSQITMRKKLLSPFIVLLLTFVVLNAPTRVYAVESPYIAVVPSAIVDSTLTPSKTFTISIYTDYAGSDITGWQLTLTYNASVLNGVSVTNGDLIVGGTAQFLPGNFDNTKGKLSLTGAFFFTMIPPPDVTTGPGILVSVTFKVVGTGTSAITLGPETKLIGWDFIGEKTYNIIDATTMFTHIQHGFFDNTQVTPPTLPPVAVITAPQIAYINETVEFSGEDSYDPDGGLIMSYSWNFGDGDTATGVTTAHNYTDLGIYVVTLVVTDEEEEISDPTQQTIEITIRPAVGLVKWKVKPEAHHWVESKDDDGNVSLTALARNLENIEAHIKVVFNILDARSGTSAGPPIVDERTLAASPQDVPITVELNPHEYGYEGTTTQVFYAHVTLWYYDPATETYIQTNPKIVRFAVVP